MINLEKAILAVVMIDPGVAWLLFQNCDDGLFTHEENKLVFQTMRDLWKDKRDMSLATIAGILDGKVRVGYLDSMLDTLRGVYDNEKFLTENIFRIKQARAKKEILREVEKEAKNPIPDLERIRELANEAQEIERERENPDIDTAYTEYLEMISKADKAIFLGYPGIDKCYRGLRGGELMVIAGRPRTYKTWLVLNSAQRLIFKTEENIGLFSLEMPKASITERLLEIALRKNQEELQNDFPEKEGLIAAFLKEHDNLKIYQKIYSTEEIRTIIERDNLKIVFLDCLNLIRCNLESPYQRASKIIYDLKQTTKDLDVVMIIIHHTSRLGGDGSEPVELSHLRDSGKIEESADFVLGLWRPDLKEGAADKWKDRVMIRLIKNRRGLNKTIVAHFHEDSGYIAEIEHEIIFGGASNDGNS